MSSSDRVLSITADKIGDQTVRLLIPSRRQDKRLLREDLIQSQKEKARIVFENVFHGAAPDAPPQIGSYRHADGSLTREDIRLVEVTASKETLLDKSKFEQIRDLAGAVCFDMDQECVLLSWGPEGYLVKASESGRNAPVARFSELSANAQEKMIHICWMGIKSIEEMLQVLSLDGWRAAQHEIGDLKIVATHEEGVRCRRVIQEER